MGSIHGYLRQHIRTLAKFASVGEVPGSSPSDPKWLAVDRAGRRLFVSPGGDGHRILPSSDPDSLAAATDAVTAALNNAGQACVLPGVPLRRLGLQGAAAYLSERMLCKDMALAYNDIAAWNYAELPHALGCQGWFTARVSTCGELDGALKTAEQADGAAYIEVVTAAYEAPPLYKKLHENVKSFYNVQ